MPLRLLPLLAVLTLATGCNVRDAVLRGTFVGGGDYTVRPNEPESVFAKHTEHVYSYRYRFYRTLIVVTADGLVIIDPMSPELSRRARAELDQRFPGVPVHTVFYSHYHLDHVRGAAAFSPKNVIAHDKAPQYWKDLQGEAEDVLSPTRTLSGDQELTIGGVTFQLLDQGFSHTDTLFSFHLPQERLVYAPDVGFVRSWPTPGPFDTYHPGYDRAMERLTRLDFDSFIPSHGEIGTKQDLIDALAFYRDVRALMSAAQKHHDTETREGLGQVFDEVYPVLKRRYGHLHGFDEMGPLNLVREMAGVNLGY